MSTRLSCFIATAVVLVAMLGTSCSRGGVTYSSHDNRCAATRSHDRCECHTHSPDKCMPLILVYVERLDCNQQRLHGRFTLIAAAWSDGLVMSSLDRVFGGAPYSAKYCAPEPLVALFDEAYGAAKTQTDADQTVYAGPDAPATVIKLACHSSVIELASWHELQEAEGFKLNDDGSVSLERDGDDAANAGSPSEFREFRERWNEIRQCISRMVDCDAPLIALAPSEVERLLRVCERMAFPR